MTNRVFASDPERGGQAVPGQQFGGQKLAEFGINLQAVIPAEKLATPMQQTLAQQLRDKGYNWPDWQLLLFGHAGRRFWQQLRAFWLSIELDDHPIDRYSAYLIDQQLRLQAPELDFVFLYPFSTLACVDSAIEKSALDYRRDQLPPAEVIGLQNLGAIAGWHHDSLLRIGINHSWGTWFAYRGLVLCPSFFQPTVPESTVSPCDSCASKPCLSACPPAAIGDKQLELQVCLDYRLQPDSPCQQRCLARQQCPVAEQHRYCEQQIRYHASCSLQTIRQWQEQKIKAR